MTTNRKAKKKKQEEKDRRQRAKWVGTPGGFYQSWERRISSSGFPRPPGSRFGGCVSQAPEICFGDDFNRADEQENVREAVTKLLDQFAFKTSDGHAISARDCFRVVFS